MENNREQRLSLGSYLVHGSPLPLEAVLPLVPSERKVEFFGVRVNAKSLRLQTFKFKGTVCVECGAVGAYFFLGKKPGDGGYHLCLVALDTVGREVLMTKDHIHPRSKGGGDVLENMQPMCEACNGRKADKLSPQQKSTGE